MEKLKIGITVGDINGIGLEVILKTLAHEKIFDICVPFLYGSTKVVSYHKNIVDADFSFQNTQSAERFNEEKMNVIACWHENVNITLGRATDLGGKYAILSLEAAVKDLRKGVIDAIVTAPINKNAMKLANFPFPGHTEYLTQELSTSSSLMLMVHDDLRVGVVTNHLPIREVADAITKELILRKLHILNETLKMDFGVERPTIAVLGLNPHAGDGGVIGKEDDELVRPAVVEAKKSGMVVMGPYPSDGFFGSGMYAKFDAVLAMYHDQGLIPFKTLSFGKGVNYTAGLSGIRTSPDHGTAYDIAGKNEADPASFRQALFMAIDAARQRKRYLSMHENVLQQRSASLHSGEDEVIVE